MKQGAAEATLCLLLFTCKALLFFHKNKKSYGKNERREYMVYI